MKRENIYWCTRNPVTGNTEVLIKQGYLYNVVCDDGSAVNIGLVFVRPYWRATHYESGLDCTPYSDIGGYSKAWKKKEDLIEAIKKIKFSNYLHMAEPFIHIVSNMRKINNE